MEKGNRLRQTRVRKAKTQYYPDQLTRPINVKID